MRKDTRHPTHAFLVSKVARQRLRFTQVQKRALEVPEGIERGAKFKPNIYRVPKLLGSICQPIDRVDSLFEKHNGLAVGRPASGLRCGLTKILDCFTPLITAHGMIPEAFDMLGQAVGIKRFDGLHDSAVEHATPLQKHAFIRHLMREGVFEGIFEVREVTAPYRNSAA